MPESSEVKLITEYLEEKLKNKMITDWEMIRGQYLNNKPKGYYEFIENLPLLVESVKCKGKLIYITLFNEDTRFYILHSLRLTGKWQDFKDNQCIWYVETDNNEKLWFRNPRRFATIEFTEDESELKECLSKLGPDILTDQLSLPVWRTLIEKHKNKNITSFLMNQNILSGIGNYIKAEALYYAKISPHRKVGELSENDSERLYEAIRIIPRVSYNKGGMNKYTEGNFYDELKIYGKKDAKKTKTSDGRITYWDPDIQK